MLWFFCDLFSTLFIVIVLVMPARPKTSVVSIFQLFYNFLLAVIFRVFWNLCWYFVHYMLVLNYKRIFYTLTEYYCGRFKYVFPQTRNNTFLSRKFGPVNGLNKQKKN